MSTISSTTSSMASELLLNKIMNGQLETDSGKTVTAGTRSSAAALSNEALTPALESAEVKKGEAYATEFQSHVTEAVNYLTNLQAAVSGAANDTAAAALLTGAKTFLATIQGTTINGVTPLAAASPTALTASLGNGQTLTIGGTAATDLATFTSSAATTKATILTAIQTAITELNESVATTGLQVQTLRGRSALYDDIAATYSDAASQQYITDVSDSTDLLENVLR